MVNTPDSDFDEDAALDSLRESLGAPHARDVLKLERDRELRGYPRNVALEKWGPEIEGMILRDMRAKQPRKPRGKVLPMVRPKQNPQK